MDIDDILASISGPSISTESRDLQLLTRAWVAERTAPEVLPYPHALIARTMDRIRDQVLSSFSPFHLCMRLLPKMFQVSVRFFGDWNMEHTAMAGKKLIMDRLRK